ncbi:MAG: hypothetical protein CML68_18115 [Rhodobacteraceae bacterium]|nr:hypothetical protein [Paracoccaceae bacterium]
MPDDTTSSVTSHRSAWLWVPLPLMVCALFAATVWLRLIGGAGRDDAPVVLIYPPHWTRAEALAATASLSVPIVDTGRLPFVFAVWPDGVDTVRNARRAGALLVLKSSALSLCAGTYAGPPSPASVAQAALQGD